MKRLKKAIHSGEIKLEGEVIACAVLEDGTRVLTCQPLRNAMERSAESRVECSHESAEEAHRPGSNRVTVFFDDESVRSSYLTQFESCDGSIVRGYKVESLLDILRAYLEARGEGKLQPVQCPSAVACDNVVRGLTRENIAELVDEATGFRGGRGPEDQQRLLDSLVDDVNHEWSKTFPDKFYAHLFRLRGWHHEPLSARRSPAVGQLTNYIVYDRLAPALREDLQRRNPADALGQRRVRHHQWLTPDIGHPRLREFLDAVVRLMAASSTWNEFDESLQRIFPRYNSQMLLPLPDGSLSVRYT